MYFCKCSIAALVLVCVGLLAGCGVNRKWQVPTEYVIYNFGNGTHASEELKRALTLGKKDYGYKLIETNPYTFRLDNVDDYDDLESVQAIIQRVASTDYAPTQLSGAAISFQSVKGSASASLQATGQATPGATVLVDAGTSKAEQADVGADGGWAIKITPTPTLLRREGAVYALIRKARTTQIVRTNVFHGSSSTVISASELPSNSPLRAYLLK